MAWVLVSRVGVAVGMIEVGSVVESFVGSVVAVAVVGALVGLTVGAADVPAVGAVLAWLDVMLVLV